MRQYGFLSRLPRYVDKGEGLTVLPSCEVCSTKMCAPMASSLRILNRPTGTNQTPRYAKSPSRSSSSLRVLRRQGAAKHKLARRQAAKLCYRFGPLTPFCALREPDRSDGTKNGFPAPNKEPTTNQKTRLDRKSPIQVRIRLPPARNLLRTSLSGRVPSKNRRLESSPLEATAVGVRQADIWSTELRDLARLGDAG